MRSPPRCPPSCPRLREAGRRAQRLRASPRRLAPKVVCPLKTHRLREPRCQPGPCQFPHDFGASWQAVPSFPTAAAAGLRQKFPSLPRPAPCVLLKHTSQVQTPESAAWDAGRAGRLWRLPPLHTRLLGPAAHPSPGMLPLCCVCSGRGHPAPGVRPVSHPTDPLLSSDLLGKGRRGEEPACVCPGSCQRWAGALEGFLFTAVLAQTGPTVSPSSAHGSWHSPLPAQPFPCAAAAT